MSGFSFHESRISSGSKRSDPTKLDLLCEVDVEKVAVQASLNRSCNPDNPVHIALGIVAVDPIDKVQGTVSSKGKEIMSRDDLCLSCLCQHEELGQDRDCLQVDGECPKDLKRPSIKNSQHTPERVHWMMGGLEALLARLVDQYLKT